MPDSRRVDRPHPTPDRPSSGAARRGALAAGALLSFGTLASLLSGGASAATAGTATARTADVEIAAGAGASPLLSTVLASLDLSAKTALQTAPSSPGSSTSTIGLAADAAAATATTGAVTAKATRTVDSTAGDSTIASADVHVLGADVLRTGVISSAATCPVSGAPTATTSAAGVSVGGRAVAATTGDSADVAVTATGLTGAAVTVAVSSPHSTTADTATATGLLVTLTLHGALTATAATVSVPLGTVTLAASSCETPSTALPAITGLAPTSGPTSGGQTVTLTGSGFTPATTVAFDGTPATHVTVSSPTSLTATSPAHPAGRVDVVATTAAGASAPSAYTYVPPAAAGTSPTATGITPDRGPVAGGQDVTIDGSGFQPGSAVSIGGHPATDVAVNPAGTQITAVTPAGTAGPADVDVTATGSPAASLPGAYTYVPTSVVPAPTVLGLDPVSGPVAGGQTVTITGSGFAPGTTATFDGLPATDVTVASGTTLTAVTPAHLAGPVGVVVTTAGDSSAPATYTYLPAGIVPVPTVAGLDPVSGPTAGGQTVTITGSGFAPGTTATFDGLPATDVTVASGTTLTAVTPAHAAGPVDVVVTTTGGSARPGTYTFEPPTATAPSVAVISPDTGPTAGGQGVVITGRGFAPDSSVEIGGHPATDVSVDTAGTEITAVTPAGSTGVVPVVVSDPTGPEASVPGGYTYLPPPELTGMTPSTGPAGGYQQVIITGSGFVDGGTTVRFGAHAATNVMVLSAGRLSVLTPPGAGSVHIVVTSPNGTATSRGLYSYVLGETFSASGGGNLPFTGTNALETVGVGCWFFAAGAWAFLFAGRTRRRD